MHRLLTTALLSSAVLSGCIYSNVRAPVSYRSPTPSDITGTLGAEVEGEACNKVVLWLVAWGDAGYSAAVEQAKAKSGATMIADAKFDHHMYNVLGVYQKSCTRVHGRAVK